MAAAIPRPLIQANLRGKVHYPPTVPAMLPTTADVATGLKLYQDVYMLLRESHCNLAVPDGGYQSDII